jgi:hypothetical protein
MSYAIVFIKLFLVNEFFVNILKFAYPLISQNGGVTIWVLFVSKCNMYYTNNIRLLVIFFY